METPLRRAREAGLAFAARTERVQRVRGPRAGVTHAEHRGTGPGTARGGGQRSGLSPEVRRPRHGPGRLPGRPPRQRPGQRPSAGRGGVPDTRGPRGRSLRPVSQTRPRTRSSQRGDARSVGRPPEGPPTRVWGPGMSEGRRAQGRGAQVCAPCPCTASGGPYSPREHLEDQDAQRPPVHAPPVAFALDDLGGQVLGRAAQGPRPGETERGVTCSHAVTDRGESPCPPRGPTAPRAARDAVCAAPLPKGTQRASRRPVSRGRCRPSAAEDARCLSSCDGAPKTTIPGRPRRPGSVRP